MQKISSSASGFFNVRSLLASSLCGVGALLAIASLTMGPPNATAQTTSGARIYVTTTVQKIGDVSTDGCSLQEAIYSSVLHDSLDGGYHGIAIDATDPDHFIGTNCVKGTGNGDTIVLPNGAMFQLTDSLDDPSSPLGADAYNYMGPTATPIIFSTMTMEANGATLQWTGKGNSRLFAIGNATVSTPHFIVSGTGSVTLRNAYIKGFHVKGGDGREGGCGGLGAGGAIYLRYGTLTVENSTFDSNAALGGNGALDSSGGGGGLSGNGGPAVNDGGGGSGGFGGGGGAGKHPFISGSGPGKGGAFGGDAINSDGGGGGALGGAIFNDGGSVTVHNSTFYNNSVQRGISPTFGCGSVGGCSSGGYGGDAGGAIFSHNGSTTIVDTTLSNNQSTGSGGGIVVYSDSSAIFTIQDTILANNGANECFFTGNVTTSGVGNLVMSNGSGTQPFGACPGVVATVDPQLQALEPASVNGGKTPTMAIPLYSSAMGVADPGTSLPSDQHNADRPQPDKSPRNGYDIGAFTVCRRVDP